MERHRLRLPPALHRDKMADLVVGVGLVLVIEGLLWALVPNFASRMLEAAAAVPQNTLRTAGWACVLAGLALVWIIRG